MTFKFGQSTDEVYNIGIMGFWAFAEMTCGFFICCLTCIPKILHDTGALNAIKRKLRIKTASLGPTSQKHYGINGPSGQAQLTPNDFNQYYKLDEDGVPMTILSAVGSEDNLYEYRAVDGINRTTDIRITRDSRSTCNTRFA